jgi:hypothetical protein
VSIAHLLVISLMRLFCTSSNTVVSTGAPSTMLARGSMRRMCASGAAVAGAGTSSSAARSASASAVRSTGAGANVIVRSSGRRTGGHPASVGAGVPSAGLWGRPSPFLETLFRGRGVGGGAPIVTAGAGAPHREAHVRETTFTTITL